MITINLMILCKHQKHIKFYNFVNNKNDKISQNTI